MFTFVCVAEATVEDCVSPIVHGKPLDIFDEGPEAMYPNTFHY